MMNERIRELWDQAAKVIDSDRDPHSWESQTRFMEQFAQLIVRECADIATINQHQYEEVGKYVLEHFGVNS
jgi:hypothetical protein